MCVCLTLRGRVKSITGVCVFACVCVCVCVCMYVCVCACVCVCVCVLHPLSFRWELL